MQKKKKENRMTNFRKCVVLSSSRIRVGIRKSHEHGPPLPNADYDFYEWKKRKNNQWWNLSRRPPTRNRNFMGKKSFDRTPFATGFASLNFDFIFLLSFFFFCFHVEITTHDCSISKLRKSIRFNLPNVCTSFPVFRPSFSPFSARVSLNYAYQKLKLNRKK